jgi:hypothetical protein
LQLTCCCFLLHSQKTHQMLAEDKKLHVVEFSERRRMYTPNFGFWIDQAYSSVPCDFYELSFHLFCAMSRYPCEEFRVHAKLR